jgi:hypothetical protein
MKTRIVALLGALGLVAALSAGAMDKPRPRAASPAPTTAPAAAAERVDQKKAVDPSAASDNGSGGCAAFDFYENNQLDKCKRECTGNRKQCIKKQQCGGKPCPDPGYCYACTKQ